jgi:hypothetical protein
MKIAQSERRLQHLRGEKIRGVVETVLSRGKVVIENGEYRGKAGDGQFLKRGTCVAM